MKIKNILITVLILGIIGAFIAYKMYNKPHVDVADASADVTIAANQLITEFSTDENSANTKYLEKIIVVKGEIANIKIEKEKGIISIKTNDDFGSILCHLSEAATKKIDSIKVGETITIKGICTGYLMDVILIKSEIIN